MLLKKIVTYSILLFTLTQLTSCSWIVGFFIINGANEEITIEMKLQDNISGIFPVFEYRDGTVYGVDKHLKVDYQNSRQITYDTLEKFSHVQFKLPAMSAVQIGTLHNDHYKKHDQYFINGRVFNLEKLIIKRSKGEVTITYDSFDRFFENRNNGVEFVVK